ncbi:MAG: hypothetical protein CMM96_04220 [Rickettsiales bacterium]|nr:hypothetical protein [Rickettsiales bacterium]
MHYYRYPLYLSKSLDVLNFLNKKNVQLDDISSDDKNLLVACILIEGAKSDDLLLDEEVNSIKKILSTKLNLENNDVDILFSKALNEVNSSVEIYSMTRDIKNKFSHEQILELFEDLWEIIIIDEFIDDYEAALMSKLSGLLGITSKESSDAKNKVLNKLNLVQD